MAILAMGNGKLDAPDMGFYMENLGPGEAKQTWENRRTEKYGIFWANHPPCSWLSSTIPCGQEVRYPKIH